MNRNLTTGGNSHTDMEETFADNLDEPSLRELIHRIMEIYQRKFGEMSEPTEPRTEEYLEQTKRHKKRCVDNKPKEWQSIPIRNNYEALVTDDLGVEDMQKTSNMMRSKNITATKCKLIEIGIEVEPATEDNYRKLGHSTHLCTKPKTTVAKCANCQGEHLSTYLKCTANPNNATINKKIIDAPLPKVKVSKKGETTGMKNETEERPAKQEPINHSGESEEKLALILGRAVLNFNSINATTEHSYNKPRN
ncbi:hypothetical protein Trydic_g16929 [Trypoxylus dichotomus]